MIAIIAEKPRDVYKRQVLGAEKGTGRAGQTERPHDCRRYHTPADQVLSLIHICEGIQKKEDDFAAEVASMVK